jgi:hypothetical protein
MKKILVIAMLLMANVSLSQSFNIPHFIHSDRNITMLVVEAGRNETIVFACTSSGDIFMSAYQNSSSATITRIVTPNGVSYSADENDGQNSLFTRSRAIKGVFRALFHESGTWRYTIRGNETRRSFTLVRNDGQRPYIQDTVLNSFSVTCINNLI